MTWVLIIGVAWLAIAAVTALVIARAIRLADEKERPPAEATPIDAEPVPRPRAANDDLSSPVERRPRPHPGAA